MLVTGDGMAATWLRPIHINRGKSIAQTIFLRTSYAQNPDKVVNKPISKNDNTEEKPITSIISDSTAYIKDSNKTLDGELVKCFECDPHTVDEEFLIAKKEYEYLTARDQGKRNILAYHIRQSFLPGEIEPEKALEVGYETGLRFTRGKHSMIVAVHTDKAHIHCHIVFNSTRLDCRGKFNNFKNSSFALQRLSDIICLEHGLSVIENPQPSKGKNYAKWLGKKEPSWQQKLRDKIDEVLPGCATFEDFISVMKLAGYKVNDKRKHITFSAPGQKSNTRLNTLKGEYTEEAIRRRIDLNKDVPKAPDPAEPIPANSGTIKVSWLIDIQAKIQEGKNEGYEHWARIFNLKEAAKTLLFLKESGIESYDDLAQKSAAVSDEFSAITAKINSIESRQKDIAELQRQIGTYGKTRDTYNAYKRSGFSPEFYETNRSDIALHQAARKHFDSLGVKKLPKISELKQEYAALQAEKKKLYASYHTVKKNSQDLLIAKSNTERILGITPGARNREITRSRASVQSPEI